MNGVNLVQELGLDSETLPSIFALLFGVISQLLRLISNPKDARSKGTEHKIRIQQRIAERFQTAVEFGTNALLGSDVLTLQNPYLSFVEEFSRCLVASRRIERSIASIERLYVFLVATIILAAGCSVLGVLIQDDWTMKEELRGTLFILGSLIVATQIAAATYILINERRLNELCEVT